MSTEIKLLILMCNKTRLVLVFLLLFEDLAERDMYSVIKRNGGMGVYTL